MAKIRSKINDFLIWYRRMTRSVCVVTLGISSPVEEPSESEDELEALILYVFILFHEFFDNFSTFYQAAKKFVKNSWNFVIVFAVLQFLRLLGLLCASKSIQIQAILRFKVSKNREMNWIIEIVSVFGNFKFIRLFLQGISEQFDLLSVRLLSIFVNKLWQQLSAILKPYKIT